MRVMFGIDSMGVGGTELNAVRTAERLVRRGVELSVVCFRPDGPLTERYRSIGVPIYGITLQGLARPSTCRAALSLNRLLREVTPDVFHAHDFYSNAFSVPIARGTGVPLVIASRRWWQSPSPARALVNRFASKAAHLVLANSESVGQLVVREGIPARRLRVIPNFIEKEAFETSGPELRLRLRAELGLPVDALLYGSIGRLSVEKGHATLLEAFARAGGDRTLVLVGDGPERPTLERQVAALGLTSRVHFAGPRPNRPLIAAAFDVVIIPSHSEGFPNALLEAMAAGRPTIATTVGGTPDAVEHMVSAVLVPPRDPCALAEAIVQIEADVTGRVQMGALALKRCKEQYHEDLVIPRLMDLYLSGIERISGLGRGRPPRSEAPKPTRLPG